MTSSSPLNFANQDLRNRSFRGKNLNGADFSGCDIRGCDFSYALLQGANFAQVRMGQTPKYFIPLIFIALVVAVVAINAVIRTIFGALGRTPAESAWSFVLALYSSLGIAGVCSGVRVIISTQSIIWRIATTLSAAASGALLSFFYAGSSTDNNPKIAIAAAVLGGIVMAVASFLFRRGLLPVAVSIAGAVTGYGFAFLIGTIASACFSTQNWILGILWGSLSIAYLWLTMNSLILGIQQIRETGRTSFKGADLTNAKFESARLENADFRSAIGYLNARGE